MSDTLSLHHIVITTRYRLNTIPEAVCKDMYRVLTSLVKKAGAFMVAINGIGNHIHMLVDFGPFTSRGALMKEVKQKSSLWATRSGKFPLWEGWAKEYYCYSVSADRKGTVIGYIMNQKIHHQGVAVEDELKKMVLSAGHKWTEWHLRGEVNQPLRGCVAPHTDVPTQECGANNNTSLRDLRSADVEPQNVAPQADDPKLRSADVGPQNVAERQNIVNPTPGVGGGYEDDFNLEEVD